jgi:hypothetical protein
MRAPSTPCLDEAAADARALGFEVTVGKRRSNVHLRNLPMLTLNKAIGVERFEYPDKDDYRHAIRVELN